jgi:AcrR family transcriptional regulator
MSDASLAAERTGERRATLLDAAVRVFARYGFKKTSMDEIARAAGLSRQALYLHFDSKEELFRAGLSRVIERMRAAARAALSDETRSPGARLLAAFEAMREHTVGAIGDEHVAELLDTSTRLLGAEADDIERGFTDDIARALAGSGAARAWSDVGVGARDLAACLMAVSNGLKHTGHSRADYLKGMRNALRIVLRKRNP